MIEPLHNLYFGISKMIKETVTAYLSFEKVLTNLLITPNKRKPLIKLRKAVPGGWQFLPFTAPENDAGGIGIREDFSRADMSSELNGPFNNTGLRGIMEEK